MKQKAFHFAGFDIGARTRESVTVNEECSGQQYRFVLPGPRLTFAERAQCLDELRTAASAAQYVVVVSLGGQGALLVTAEASQRIPAVTMRSGSGVGAGDANGGRDHGRIEPDGRCRSRFASGLPLGARC